MNGAHDLGGKHGFGEIDQSQDMNFAAEWEEKVFALTLASGMLGCWNLDQSRSAREQMDPAHYLNSSYYEHWLFGLEQLLVETNLLTEEELRTGVSEPTHAARGVEAADPEKMQKILDVGGPTLLESTGKPQFGIGDPVAVRATHPVSHTRAPGYVKGKVGVIVSHHGEHIFADEHASSGRKIGKHLYGVRFEAKSLWGTTRLTADSAASTNAVYVDLFEPYLQTIAQFQQQLGASRSIE